MNKFIETLREELSKEDLTQINRELSFQMLENIEDEIDMMENENWDLEQQIDDLENDIESMRCDLDDFKKPIKGTNFIDSEFKKKIFDQLSEKYTWYQLEELLKNNKMI
jgi:hypothetical protein